MRSSSDEPGPTCWARLSTNGRVSVVGESYYQKALKRVTRGRTARNFEEAIQVRVELVPEPRNPHDRNAVAVVVDGQKVGYLAREVAVSYQPPLLALVREGQRPWCPGRIMGGGDRYYGIHLHLGSPEHVIMSNQPEGLEIFPDADRTVTVTGEQAHQDVLEPYRPGSSEFFTPVFAGLAIGTVERGKYAGQPAILVSVDGRYVGALTGGMSARYLSLVQGMFERGQRPGCEAVICEGQAGLQIDLLLPKTAT